MDNEPQIIQYYNELPSYAILIDALNNEYDELRNEYSEYKSNYPTKVIIKRDFKIYTPALICLLIIVLSEMTLIVIFI